MAVDPDEDHTLLYEQLIAHLNSLADAEPDEWKDHMLESMATILRMWFLEGTPHLKQRMRKAEDEAKALRAELITMKEVLSLYRRLAADGVLRLKSGMSYAQAQELYTKAQAIEHPDVEIDKPVMDISGG